MKNKYAQNVIIFKNTYKKQIHKKYTEGFYYGKRVMETRHKNF